MHSEPKVGIFWKIRGTQNDELLVDVSRLDEAEKYGEYLTHPRGHYEAWEQWKALGIGGLRRRNLPTAIAHSEYEDFPRGRVVCHAMSRVFTVYADRKLHGPESLAAIANTFHLQDCKWVVRSDSHYRTGGLAGLYSRDL